MSAQHHYVSKFHLNHFLDPDSLSSKDPWVWQGFIPDGPVKRRAPKNVATMRLMFNGPGALADRNSTVESFLAREIEGPAAEAFREVCSQPLGCEGTLPPALTRYLAWAAARSLPMQTLENSWGEKNIGHNDEIVEPPPKGLAEATELHRDVAMRHPTLGSRVFPVGSDFQQAAVDGWYLDMSDQTNFLESVHVQAYYFQERFFPRLRWYSLHAPVGKFFVIADRAVGWAADGYINAPPNCLRDPSAYVLAPISRNLVLVGRHGMEKWNVTVDRINAVIACWAHQWIVGPTQSTVESSLESRRFALDSGDFYTQS